MVEEQRRHIHVVAALFERDGQVLLDRRRKGTHLAELWEFPGGKREAGESDEAALVREIREELGVSCRVTGPQVGRIDFAYEDFDLTLVLYPAEFQGTPRALDVAEIAWHPKEALKELPMPPADRPLLEAVLQRSPEAPSTP